MAFSRVIAAALFVQVVTPLRVSPEAFSVSYKNIRLQQPSPAQEKITKAILPQPTAVPNYVYNYVIDDPRSGDRKSQEEVRQGDFVHGRYSLIDADGTRRIVEYTADPKNGFNAVVRRELLENSLQHQDLYY